MTWREQAAEIIREGTKHLPEDMPLKERKAAVAALCPSWWRQMSWPQKAWQAARRDYLARYGYKPKTKRQAEKEAAALPLFGDDPR